MTNLSDSSAGHAKLFRKMGALDLLSSKVRREGVWADFFHADGFSTATRPLQAEV